ncbi:xanthohumol 4'-O-methyltransferase-like [Heracleum sosnowskyi]|uniref:Xanthohumol 4'-O-methyltransferase-like n=1 Tax=Heracleum sosnowskyi TaxID=360622 RepID=A0AAD8HN89_9APIA|nr:xanthohumol 4'-O-methyltransferase-like [Heracleum sosnowskyi]
MAEITKGEATNGNDETAQAQVDIWRFVFGFAEMAVAKCAIELGIPDILENHGDPMTLSQLSTALSCSSAALFRIMRFLMNRGIFKEKITKEGCMGYVQTPLSRLLTKDGHNSLAPLLLFQNSSVIITPWHFLSACVMDNNLSAFAYAYGKDTWKYTAENPGHNKFFEEAMACDTRRTVPAVLDGCPELFTGLSSVVDVGGGDGTALRILIKTCPWIHGINFDLPHVLSLAPECEGIEHVGGDMFISVPKANVAFLKWVLHDWNDDKCIKILKNCKEAISEYGTTGKVIIVDAVIEVNGGDKLKDVGLMLDMVMLTHTNMGKERTAEEWAYVLSEAGFTRHTIKNIQAVSSVIEAYP